MNGYHAVYKMRNCHNTIHKYFDLFRKMSCWLYSLICHFSTQPYPGPGECLGGGEVDETLLSPCTDWQSSGETWLECVQVCGKQGLHCQPGISPLPGNLNSRSVYPLFPALIGIIYLSVIECACTWVLCRNHSHRADPGQSTTNPIS